MEFSTKYTPTGASTNPKNLINTGTLKVDYDLLTNSKFKSALSFFQLRQQLYKSQCRSVGRSVGLSVGLFVCQQRVLQKCYAVGSVYMLLVLLQFRILDHSVVIYCNFSCDSSSIDRNVSWSVCLSATSFIEVLCYYQYIIVLAVFVVYDIKIFCQLRQQLYKS